MKILVTGGAGFIGSHVVDAYVAAGHDVAVVDNLSTGRRERVNPAARFYETDIRDPALRGVLERERPAIVSHQAAQASVIVSTTEPRLDAEVNILGSIHLFALSVEFDVRRIVFASTGGAIYGDPDAGRLPVDEACPPRPQSPYGISKFAGETYLRYFGTRGPSWAVLRYANVYGPRQDPHGEAGVVAIFTRAMLDGRTPTIFGDGTQTRDFVYVEDVAHANVLAVERSDSETVNIGTGTETTVKQIFSHLAEFTGFLAKPQYVDPRPGEVYRIALHSGLARTWLGWTPQTPLASGLRTTVEWFRRHA